MIGKILYEVYKNFKLIIRSWSTLLLIVLAPLILILAVGYSFSGDSIHNVKIGVLRGSGIDIHELEQEVGLEDIKEYDSMNDCLYDMALEETHMCLEISGDLTPKPGELPSGVVNFYYDNSRKKISLLLLSEMKSFFGLTSERISLISTQEIIDNLQNLLTFLNQRIDDVDSIKNESRQIMDDLGQRKQKLIDARDDFEPRYLYIKGKQPLFNRYRNDFESQSNDLVVQLEGIQNSTSQIRSSLDTLNITNKGPLYSSLDTLDGQIDNVTSSVNNTVAQADEIADTIDRVIIELDQIDLLLNEEINRTDEYITLINESTMKIEAVSSEAKEKMSDLSNIDPSLAAKIAKPISQEFTAILKNLKDIQVAFPVLLSTVIIFISLVFSNIITSLELHNDAFTRNILAPVNDLVYTAGLAITNFIVISFQVVVLLIVAQANFSLNIISNLADIIPPLVILIFTFVFMGMIIAYLTKTIQSSILISTFTALFFFLFSDAINAIEAMPEIAATVARFNPIVIINSMFRQILFFNIPLEGLYNYLGVLIIYMCVSGLLLLFVSKIKNKERL